MKYIFKYGEVTIGSCIPDHFYEHFGTKQNIDMRNWIRPPICFKRNDDIMWEIVIRGRVQKIPLGNKNSTLYINVSKFIQQFLFIGVSSLFIVTLW